MQRGEGVKVEIVMKPELKEPHIVVYTNEITEEIQRIVDRFSNSQNKILTGIKDKKIFLLENEEIYCFFGIRTYIAAGFERKSEMIPFVRSPYKIRF